MVSRRDFLKAAVGAVIPSSALAGGRPDGFIRSLYLGLGNNMWCEWPTDGADLKLRESIRPDLKLRCRDDLWRKVTDHAAVSGVNTLVIDLGEGLRYPSHPELAVEGSWSPEKMRDEVARLKAMGVAAVPKLNFSTSHNGWMKEYRHMVSSSPYYRMCEDVNKAVLRVGVQFEQQDSNKERQN